MGNLIISNPAEFEEKKKRVLEGGKENFHVLADFDRTLTKAFINGKKVSGAIAELRNGNYISKDYAEKATALAEKYHPIEIDPNLGLEEKSKEMYSWWSSHFRLLIESGLNKKHIEQIVKAGKIQLREGALSLLDFLYEKQIPLVIMSAGGLGGDAISMILEKNKRFYDNIHIISNSYEWDENGRAIDFKKPVIHVLNKGEFSIKELPNYDELLNRKNVLLLGDSLGDLGMIEGFDYENLIKIGFLNDRVEESLESFKKSYDVLILNDEGMEFVNSFIKEIK